jgi:hypothetical protein
MKKKKQQVLQSWAERNIVLGPTSPNRITSDHMPLDQVLTAQMYSQINKSRRHPFLPKP